MADTKEQLILKIKEYISIKNEIDTLSAALKDRKKNLKLISNFLIDTMKTHEIDSFDINNGKLKYSQNKVKQPINKSLLLESLSKYVSDLDSINEITQHILDSRVIKVKDNLRFKEKN